MTDYERDLTNRIRNSYEAQYAIAIIGERVLIVESARETLLVDPEAAERDFSPFILSIARAPEVEWLHDCFIRLPGMDHDGNMVLIPRKRTQAVVAPQKKEG